MKKIKFLLSVLFFLLVLPGCTLMHYDFGVGGGSGQSSSNVRMTVSEMNNASSRVKYVGKFFSMNLVYRGISGRVKKSNSLLNGTEDYLLRLCDARNTSVCSNKFHLPWYQNKVIDKLKLYRKVTIKGTLVGVKNDTRIGISRSRAGSFDHVAILEVHPYSPATSGGSDSQGLSVTEIKYLQQKLNQLGFDAGPADGVLGNKTKSAIIAFQKSRGLTPDGVAGSKTMTALKNTENSSDNSSSQSQVSSGSDEQATGDVESIPNEIRVFNDTSLKSKPDLFSQTLISVKEGEILGVVSQNGDWYEVQYLNENGYILSSDTTPQ